METRTDQAAVIVISVILLAMVTLAFAVGNTGKRILCHTWKIRSDGDFEAETNSGTILFRREDIHLIEPHSENDVQTWVCIGNLQRMVWIEFAHASQASQFVNQMEQLLSHRRF